MFIRSAQSTGIPVPQQAPAVPLQSGVVPATTAQQFDMTTMMNMIMMLMFLVMMVKVMGQATASM